MSGSLLGMVPESLDGVLLHLQGLEIEGFSMRASVLRTSLINSLRAQLINFSFSILYSYFGYFGTSVAGQVLGACCLFWGFFFWY